MQIKIPILASIVVLLTVLAIPLAAHPVKADNGLNRPYPANIWSPYGPNLDAGKVSKLLFVYYSDPNPEFTDFELGKVDVVDWEVDFAKWGTNGCPPGNTFYGCNTPNTIGADVWLSQPLQGQGQFGDFGMYWNAASSRFNAISGAAGTPFWGCNWNNGGTPFTNTFQSYVSACGKDMRAAFAHLYDRQAFTDPRVLAQLVCPSPTAKDPSCQPDGTCNAIQPPPSPATQKVCVTIADECSWDDPAIVTLVPGVTAGACLDGFRYGHNGSVNGDQTVGSVDFCIAAQYMIAALKNNGSPNIASTPGTCVLTGVNPSVFAHPFRSMVRTSEPRLDMGKAWDKAMNELFGQTVVIEKFGNIRTIGHAIVFSDNCFNIACYTVGGNIDDWDMYTYGYGLGSPYPDHLFGLYNGSQASNFCGGPHQQFEPNNDQFVCNPTLDASTKATSLSLDPATFKANARQAFIDWGNAAVDLPVFDSKLRTVALKSVAGIVNAVGIGYNNANTLQFASQNAAYTPQNPKYAFGGGVTDTLRYGQASGTTSVDLYNSQTVWEFQLAGEVYDTLFSVNPVAPTQAYCNMCDAYTTFQDGAGNEHFVVELRQNLKWQDGVPVTSADVAFSFLTARDFSTNWGGALFNLLDANVVDSRTVDISYLGSSISYPIFNSLLIMPQHIWQTTPDSTYHPGIGVPDAAKLDQSYDPIASGTFIGSGPFACISGTLANPGTIGKGCAPSQQLNPGDSLVLTAYDFTKSTINGSPVTNPFLQYILTFDSSWGTHTVPAGDSGQFQEFKWADKNTDGQVTISEVQQVESCAGQVGTGVCATAFIAGLHGAGQTTVTIEPAIAASHLDDGYVLPLAWNSLSSGTLATNIITYP